jgi:UDP-N-acetyl-D-mannosaminuronate dehydrogenase
MVEDCDAVVVMVKHDAYGEIDWDALRARLAQPVVVDGRRVVPGTLPNTVTRVVGRGRHADDQEAQED